MNEKEQKMTVSIYKIDLLKDLFHKKTFNEVVDIIMKEAKNYNEEELRETVIDTRIFYKFSNPSYKKWKDFLNTELKEDDNFLILKEDGEKKIKSGRFLSIIIFFHINKNIFVITSGKGYLEIEKYAENYFGLEVITKLLSKNSNVLKRIADNSLIGSKFENISYFRSKQSFLSQDDFGKIIKEAIAELNKGQLSSIGIDVKERINSKINCIAKTHFTPKTGVTLYELKKKILPKIVELLKKDSNFNLNKVKEINKKDPLYEKLMNSLKKELYKNFLSFDFFPIDNIDDFFQATSYNILGEDIEDFDLTYIEKIYNLLNIKNIDFSEFESKLNKYIYAKDENGEKKNKGFSLLRGLHGEFKHKGNTYFWLNGKFWIIDKVIIEEFNEKMFSVFKEEQLDVSLNLGKIDLYTDEGDYNKDQQDNFLVLDKRFIKHIEFADLFKVEDDKVYIIHVKKGFDRDIRVLSSQISTSARLLQGARSRAKESDKKLFRELFNKGINNINMSEQDFIDALFDKKKKIIYVLAFGYKNKINNIEDVKKIKSSIAKLELFEIFKNFRTNFHPFELKILQLDTTNNT